MRRGRPGFTLIEVMLAVAIFAFAVVGFGVALNEVLGINAEFLQRTQRQQALDSVAAQVLAVSNNLQETGWAEVPGWGSDKTWRIFQRIQPVPVFELRGPDNTNVVLVGWWRVELRVQTARESQASPGDRISFLLWGQR